MRVRESLKAFKDLSAEKGADLRYNKEVVKIDESRGEVFLSKGKILKAKWIVLAAGCFSQKLLND